MSITVEITEDVACINWDDGKANAVNLDMISAMNSALDEANASAKSIVIAGRPGVFCGGFDLKILQNAAEEEVEHLIDQGGELAERLFTFSKPVVMACTGHAIAQGAAFLLAGDIRIGAKGNFKIGLNETQIGMPLRHFGPTLAKARLAQTFYTRAAILGELFDPDVAVEVGYLDETGSEQEIRNTAFDRAVALAALPTKAFELNKLAMRKAAIEALKRKEPL
ncbi:MAG: crotonase/enoyl-CoA hydratase family protein [Pseudomonadota bacterium]